MREPLCDDDECDVYVSPYDTSAPEPRATMVVAVNGIEVQRTHNVKRGALRHAALRLLAEAMAAGAHFAFHTSPGIGWTEERIGMTRMRYMRVQRRKQ